VCPLHLLSSQSGQNVNTGGGVFRPAETIIDKCDPSAVKEQKIGALMLNETDKMDLCDFSL
jgi:hypothetical protein